MVSNEVIKKLFDGLNIKDGYNKEYSKIYKLHKYWARKPWYIIEKYIQRYSEKGDLVFDPFCGSGTTGLEAILSGRNFLGYDLNPIAVLISNECMNINVDIKKLEDEFKDIELKCSDEIQNFYLTDEFCAACGSQLRYKYISCGPKFAGEYTGRLYCASCNDRSSKICKALDFKDLQIIKDAENIELQHWVPNIKFPQKFYKDRFSYKGISNVTDMHTRRNLLSLSILHSAIKDGNYDNHNIFTLAFTNTILHASKLKGENVRPLGVNNYWVPDDYIEENVWFRFADRVKHAISGKTVLKNRAARTDNIGDYKVLLKSATDNDCNEMVDYVFTDPPYGDAIQYSELSYVWNAWIQQKYDIKEEVIVNPTQNKNSDVFYSMINKALDRIYKQLKPGRYFTLCFQNKDFKVWKNVLNKCKDLGYSLVDVEIYDVYGNPFNKYWSKFSPKADIYVTFKKDASSAGFNTIDCDVTVSEIVHEILNYMKYNSITIDISKIYDITVSYIIWALYSCQETCFDDFSVKSIIAQVEKYYKEEL